MCYLLATRNRAVKIREGVLSSAINLLSNREKIFEILDFSGS